MEGGEGRGAKRRGRAHQSPSNEGEGRARQTKGQGRARQTKGESRRIQGERGEESTSNEGEGRARQTNGGESQLSEGGGGPSDCWTTFQAIHSDTIPNAG